MSYFNTLELFYKFSWLDVRLASFSSGSGKFLPNEHPNLKMYEHP